MSAPPDPTAVPALDARQALAGAQFVLASASPRRRELLAALGLRFTVLPADIDESQWPDEPALAHVCRLARSKAQAVAGRPEVLAHGLPVLAADTIVVVDAAAAAAGMPAKRERVLGKPASREDALAMLALLSGCTHRVLTAVAVASRAGVEEVVSETAVTFRHIHPREAAAYWDTGEPRDKAGAYGIQGLGGIFAERIEGSFTGVMGLPVADTEALLRRAGVDTWAHRAFVSRS